jgi:gamma-glutamyltranspeptidase/glutathione hydrolase
MAPTMVFDAEGRLQMLLGSPGGSMIINYVAKTLVAALDWGMDVQGAAGAPNFGSRNGPTVLERGTPYEKLAKELFDRNHPVEIVPLESGVHAIERVPGGWRGGADPRREGIAAGR